MNLYIRGATVQDTPHDIAVSDGRITSIRPQNGEDAGAGAAGRVIDARGLHAFPSLHNGHTHVAMVLFRGYGDDMPLMQWLRTRIWPAESRLTEDDVYAGARLGILEMIRGGTTFFNEMYWHRPALVRAAEDMGVRALIGQTLIDVGQPGMVERQKNELRQRADESRGAASGRVRLCAAPHSIYMLALADLEWVAEFATQHDLLVHIHLSETDQEVENCVRAHGCRPAVLLERAGLVNARLVTAHGQFLDEEELALLGSARAAVVSNPAANLKLATGGIFPLASARARGVRVCLGTDGAASNNTLSMIEAMKFAALLQKHRDRDAASLPASDALALVTSEAGAVFRLGTGRLEVGAPADLMLVDFSGPATQPLHDPVSQLVYAANASCVHTTICDGRVLMHGGVVEICDEREVIESASAAVRSLLQRVS